MRTAVKNAADQRQVHAAEDRTRRQERTDREELRELLRIEAFRRYVWRVLDRTPIAMALDGPGSAELLNYREGLRAIGVAVLSEVMQADPEAYALMQREANRKDVDDGGTDDPPDTE